MDNHILKEEIDFIWLTKNTPFGEITTDPKLIDGTVLKREKIPRGGSIVYLSKEEELRPVKVISGEYESNGRVSNFWSWYEVNEDMSLGELKSGYGFFYAPPNGYNFKRQ